MRAGKLDNVVDLKTFKATLRYGSRWGGSGPKCCEHRTVVLDQDDCSVECEDCGRTISAFAVLFQMVKRWGEIAEQVQALKTRAAAVRNLIKNYKPRLRALKQLEKHWWTQQRLPTCPHCHRGLLPEDFADSMSFVSKEYELKRRDKEGFAERRWR